MTMLKTYDLRGNKQSFATWISNLSPCETPFSSMVNKQSVDQVQYSWQTDRLAAAGKVNAGIANADADLPEMKEGEAIAAQVRNPTEVHHNFTQILRKVVRVSDTTKNIGLYGRASELALQMEKAGMELKRDLEYMMLNNDSAGQIGTSAQAGRFAGFYPLCSAPAAVCKDTGAVVHKVISYAAAGNPQKFLKKDVLDLTTQLYIAGSKANKIMLHPMHMFVFADWIADTLQGAGTAQNPHLHRMFDGLDTKYNAHVSKIRDRLGQEFTLIPNRHMPKNRLYFFNEADWTQMLLREPNKVELAKNGSSEKHMIEMEIGLRHKNPFASGILEFNVAAFPFVQEVEVQPGALKADDAELALIKVRMKNADGSKGDSGDTFTVTATAVNDDGSTTDVTPTVSDITAPDAVHGIGTAKVKHKKAAKIKVTVQSATGQAGTMMHTGEATVGAFDTRD